MLQQNGSTKLCPYRKGTYRNGKNKKTPSKFRKGNQGFKEKLAAIRKR